MDHCVAKHTARYSRIFSLWAGEFHDTQLLTAITELLTAHNGILPIILEIPDHRIRLPIRFDLLEISISNSQRAVQLQIKFHEFFIALRSQLRLKLDSLLINHLV